MAASMIGTPGRHSDVAVHSFVRHDAVMKDRSSVNSNYRLLKPASKKRPALAKLRYEPAPPRCKLTVAPGGGGAVERAGRLHFSFHPLHSAGPDLEVSCYCRHALFGPELSLYSLLYGDVDLGASQAVSRSPSLARHEPVDGSCYAQTLQMPP